MRLFFDGIPWRERNGRFSAFKLAGFLGLLAPGLWMVWLLASGNTGPRPVDELTHETGRWAVWFLLGSLAVTPLRRLLGWPQILKLRRQIGLAAMVYILLHFALYFVEQKLDPLRVAREIVLRFYLTIGFVALAGLVALGATSTDSALRRMGKAWGRLHRLVYLIALLGLVHYLLQAKRELYDPTLQVGLFGWLMLYRAGYALGWMRQAWQAWLLAPLAGLLAAAAETGWVACCTELPWRRVMYANLNFDFRIAPAWWVLAAGLLVALLALVLSRAKALPSMN